MSWEAIRWAHQQKPRTATCKYVLLAFANYSDKDGQTWASWKTLSDYTLLNRKTHGEAIEKLIADGYMVETDKRYGQTGRIKSTNCRSNSPVSGLLNSQVIVR